MTIDEDGVTVSAALRGITWAHDRGLAPLLATASEWRARGGAPVEWATRSLKGFGEVPLLDLVDEYDLLVIDHPFIGRAAEQGVLLPLEPLLGPGYLADQATGSVGTSHESYRWDGRQLALAIDAAAQVTAWRPDLVVGAAPPSTWAAVLDAASGPVGMGLPMNPTDVVPTFLTLACATGPSPFHDGRPIPPRQGVAALDLLRRLAAAARPWTLDANPIELLDEMAAGDDIWFAPALFGYTNYSRPGYRLHRVAFAGLPASSVPGAHGGATLGGAGIAVSARSRHAAAAADYAAFVASPDVQAGSYVTHGGQPAHRKAWDDPAADQLSGGFFTATRETMAGAYVRPRHAGYLDWQDGVGPLLADFARGRGRADAVLAELNRRFLDTLADLRVDGDDRSPVARAEYQES